MRLSHSFVARILPSFRSRAHRARLPTTGPPGDGRREDISMRTTRFAAALAGLLALAPAGAFAQSETEEAAAPGFNDTSVEYKYGPNYREPGIRGMVPKHIL